MPGEFPVLGEQPGGEFAEPLGEVGGEAEQLHLLGAVRVGAEIAQVIGLAPVRAAAEGEAVAAGVEVQLVEEGRDQGEHQEQHQPRQHRADRHRERHRGDEILELAEQLADQVRAPGDLAPGALQLVLHRAVLELLEVEGGGVRHQAQGRGVADFLRQHPVDVGRGSPEQVRDHREPELDSDEEPDMMEPRIGQPAARGRRPGPARHHGIDHELGHIEHQGRQPGAQEAQGQAGEGETRIGRDGEAEQGGEMAQRPEPGGGGTAPGGEAAVGGDVHGADIGGGSVRPRRCGRIPQHAGPGPCALGGG